MLNWRLDASFHYDSKQSGIYTRREFINHEGKAASKIKFINFDGIRLHSEKRIKAKPKIKNDHLFIIITLFLRYYYLLLVM